MTSTHSPSQLSTSESRKGQLQEKFVYLYREMFSGRGPINSTKEKGIQGRAALTRFWDELLLLKVNETFLEQCISTSSEDKLKGELKPVLNELFGTCTRYLVDGNFIRVAHALETLIVIFTGIFKKRFTEQGFTIITLVAGSLENADAFFTTLIANVARLLTRDDVPIPVKSLSLRVYLTVLMATDNINTNPLASYFLVTNVFDAVLAALTVKLADDRKCLELDATLILVLLLLWRESGNAFAEVISSPSAPLGPLLQTASSLLSFSGAKPGAAFQTNLLLSSGWSVTDGMLSLFGSLFGFSGMQEAAVAAAPKTAYGEASSGIDEVWLNNMAGLLLTYFLVYLNPVMKSSQVWPSSDTVSQFTNNSQSQALASVWAQAFKSLIHICKENPSELVTAEPPGVLRVKLCLILMRCFLEGSTSADFLAQCNADGFVLGSAPLSTGGITGIPYTIPFKSVLCIVLDFSANLLHIDPNVNTSTDSDLFYRASVLVPLAFKYMKQKCCQLSGESINWTRLWKGFGNICKWAAHESTYQKPGVSDLVELMVGLFEFCLAIVPDICPVPEVSESLHAVVMEHMDVLEQLVDLAKSIPTGQASSLKGGLQLVNVMAVKAQYEIQVAALGVRGKPSYEQALEAVKKKGASNLKLKGRHAGPSNSYAEGTMELRLLTSIVRGVIAQQRKQSILSSPKLEVLP